MQGNSIVESQARAAARRVRTAVRRWRYRRASSARTGVRLHLGCGQEYWPGWVNIDADPGAQSDLCARFEDLDAVFAPGSVAEAVMIHSLSYLSLWQAREFFGVLHRLLQPGGTLVIELPDVDKCAASLLERRGDLDAYLEALRGLFAFDLAWVAERRTYAPYAFGWSAWHLQEELRRAGFASVVSAAPRTHGAREWRDTRVEATR